MNNISFTFPEVNVPAELREFPLLDKTVLFSPLRMPFERAKKFTLNGATIYVQPRFDDFRGHHTYISVSPAKLFKGGDNKIGFSRVADFHKNAEIWLPILDDKLCEISGQSEFELYSLTVVETETAFNLRVLREGDDWRLLNYLAGKNLPRFLPTKKCSHKRTIYFNDKKAYEPVYRKDEIVLKANGEPRNHPPRRVATVYLPEENRVWNKNEYRAEFIVRFEERFSARHITSRLRYRKLPNNFWTLLQPPVMNELFLSGALIHLFDKKTKDRIKQSLLDFTSAAA